MRSTITRKRLLSAALVAGAACSAELFAHGGTRSHQERVPPGAKSYFGRFTDADCYVLAMGADLQAYRTAAGEKSSKALREMNDTAVKVYKKGGETYRDGRWLFEPGIYEDHPDTTYAGRTEVTPDMAPARVKGIGNDTSHFMRWPMFLSSHVEALGSSTPRGAEFVKYRTGLTKQFLTKVLVPPGPEFRGYRVTNYMDGTNGIYRYKYSASLPKGFGPYELSSSLLCGWWVFLHDDRVSEMYRKESTLFPFTQEEADAYLGPSKAAPYFPNGSYELDCRLAGKLNLDGGAPAPSEKIDEKDHALWSKHERSVLSSPIWRGSAAESAQFTLMLPLHAAFLNGDKEMQKDFADHFARFAEKGPLDMTGATLLGKMEYLYFATRFLVLAQKTGHSDLIPPRMAASVEEEVERLWDGDNPPLSNTGYGEPRFTNYRDYIEWKLALER